MTPLLAPSVTSKLESLPKNFVESFANDPHFVDKGIKMWAHVSEIEEPRTPKALLENLCLLFSMRQGTAQSNREYLSRLCRLLGR